MRILVVEDDDSLSVVIARFISAWGWSVDLSPSIRSALERLGGGGYDAAICDGCLPDGDGVFLAQALKRGKPALPVVMMSGDPAVIERAQEAGITPCLCKPFAMDDLRFLIEQCSGMKGCPPV